ncbi:tape measure protein [uncultured Duncaniella sp.]|uniref:tape measure protein n=1 Tax=uncultured Duncaniella sp. TaxID=2768039 RepID=UPI0025A9BDD4|nr:tape measure protein [uncultured Duncaniella sp.]
MANNLIFPIGFDLESGVQDAIKKGDAALRQIEAAMNRKPIVLRAEVDANKFQMFSRQFTNSIDGISAKLAQAQRIWNSMSFDVKFDSEGNLSRRAQIVFDAFQQLTQASATMGQRLGEVNRNLAKSEADTARAITAEYNKRQQLINEQIRLKERQAAAEERVHQSQLKGVNVGYVDTQKQVEAVRNLRLQYEAILPMLNAMAQRRYDIKVGIDKQFEADIQRINAEIARLRQSNLQLGAKGDTNAIQANLQAIRQLEAELQRISQQKIDLLNSNKINSDLARLRTEISSVFGELQNAERKLAADNSLNSALDTQSQKVLKLHADIQKLDQQIAQLNAQGKMYNADGSFSTQAISILQQRIALTKQLEQEAITGQQAQIRLEQQLREEKRKTEQEAKNAAKEAERQAKAEAAARKQAQDAANAENKARQEAYNARRRQGQETQRILNKEAKSIADITAKLQIQQQRLQSANIGSAKFNKIAEEVKRLTQELDKANKKMRELTGQTQSSAATQSAAVRQVSQEFQAQDGYVSRLLKRMAVYAGYSMATNFLTSIREVTAQFELQRISLGAIIQDQQKANQIFAEIKSFALTSPLKVLDLTKYAKQVAAYGFEADRIFDVTKRLADISVGLGVDMGRLTLAVSQIRAATVLKSSELRQLTETGLPMLDLLSKKLTETQGKLVSAADVMDLISKRAISYEMVEEILYDLTDAGGMFYNMQVKQSQTLFGMWSKLGDAAAIMYDQIGNTSTVNAGMKTTMGLLESMMRNWKTTARVLDTVSVALAVYVIGLKNAAVTSSAMTTAEAARLAITNRQIIATPKLIAAIIGQNTATKLSTTLTKAHTVAMLNQSTATNVLSRGFWKLTAAMLANPWVAAAAGIALVVTALIHFIGNTETAAERAEKLNNSVASLKNLEDTTKPLIDIYNELINKTERTAEEQKKLSEVTHELAKQYPGAITAIGNFGEEVDLAADKLNKLYQAEKQARMDNTRFELEQTEKKIKEVEAEIEKYQQQLASGEKTIYKRLGDSGLRTKKVVPLTEEDKGNILKRIDELRYGEDGQSGLFGLQQSAEAARRALGLIPSEAAQAVEKFGAWKKTFTTFQQQVGQTKVRLFDESTINQFGSLEEALKKTAEEYKKNIALVATYDEVLKSTTLTAEERAKIEGERAEADAMANLAEKALKYYNAMSLLNTSTSGRGTKSDNRLQNLQEIERTLTSINKKYEELAKTEGNTAALEYVRENYDSTLKYINKLGKQFNLNFAMPTDFKDLQSYRKAIQGVIEQLKMKGYEKAAIELELKIAEGNQAQLQKEIQAKLKALADRISRTKTAKEFYEKILSQTGDVELAARVSLSIYGSTGEELFKDTVKQIKEVFKTGNKELDKTIEMQLDYSIDTKNERINYQYLAEIYDYYQDQIIEKNRSTAENIIKEGQKTAASNIATWEKELAKAKDYEEQRTDIINRETQRRAEIYKSNLPQEEKDRLAAQSQKKQDEDLAKVNFEEFTKSEDYIKVFENLDNTSTSTLKRLRTELQALIDTNKDLSPENMKTLVKAMEDIDEQISGRGFGNDMVQSVNDYIASIKNLKTAKQELAKAEAEYESQEPRLDTDIETAKAEKESADEDVVTAQQKLLDIQTQMAALREQEIVDETQLAALQAQEVAATNALTAAKSKQNQAATAVVNAEQAKAKAADKVKKAEQKVSGEQDKQKKATTKFFKDLQQVAATADQLANILGDVKDVLQISEDSAAGVAFDSAIEGLQTMSKLIGIVTAAQAIYNVVTSANPWMAIAAAVLAVGSILGSWISNSKVRKANKEIERQQELLDQLEYTYGRLEKAADKLFGADYLNNYNQQLKNLQAQQAAYLKQAEAERSKGKKEDKEKTQEYLNNARDVADQIADMQGKIAERMLGTDLTSAARDFANAWLEAYKEFGNTADAMSEKFHEMIQNMIVESLLAKVMERALKPAFDMIDNMNEEDFYSESFWKKVMATAEQGAKDADHGAGVVMKWIEKMGYDMREMGSEYSGIAKEVSSASSEEINQLSAFVNTALYYVSPIPTISENVSLIRQLMERGTTSTLPDTTAAGWTDWQQQAMDNYIAIQRNTADTVVECRRAANACEAATEKLNRAFRAKGATTGFNVFLNS